MSATCRNKMLRTLNSNLEGMGIQIGSDIRFKLHCDYITNMFLSDLWILRCLPFSFSKPLDEIRNLHNAIILIFIYRLYCLNSFLDCMNA